MQTIATPVQPLVPAALTPPPPPATTGAMGDDDRARRRAVLSDPDLHEAVRAVARLRGVPRQDVDDTLNTVIGLAMVATGLPLEDREQTRTFLCALARCRGIDGARKRKVRAKREEQCDDEGELAATAEFAPDQALLAEQLLNEAKQRFPRTFPWFFRTVIKGEPVAKVAVEAHVRPDHVRHEVAVIRSSLRGFSALAVLFAIVTFMHHWTLPGHGVDHGHELSATASPSVTPPPALSVLPPAPSAPPSAEVPTEPTPEELRASARAECDRGQWELCLLDLDRASRLDPQGDTPELIKLRKLATVRLMSNAKP